MCLLNSRAAEISPVPHVADDRMEASLLALYEQLTPTEREQIEVVRRLRLKTARAWAIKELARSLGRFAPAICGKAGERNG